MTGHIQTKRIYEAPSAGDGVRVLVDRIWPRGMSKTEAAVDRWIKDIAPSAALRKWFGHRPERWAEFRRRYALELDGNPEVVAELQALLWTNTVTLLYAAKDVEHNNALALRLYLAAQR
jgi:uncharacterized protein YeaO (DUF488 family)